MQKEPFLPLLAPAEIQATEGPTHQFMYVPEGDCVNIHTVYTLGKGVTVTQDTRVTVEDLFEEVPERAIVAYALENQKIASTVKDDRPGTFKLLGALNYELVKEWVACESKYYMEDL